MKTVQKFFDDKQKETTSDKATVMIEQTLDDSGTVVREAMFFRSPEDVVPKSKRARK